MSYQDSQVSQNDIRHTIAREKIEKSKQQQNTLMVEYTVWTSTDQKSNFMDGGKKDTTVNI